MFRLGRLSQQIPSRGKRRKLPINFDALSAIVAALALIISLTTLWLARRTDQRDAFYREVGIRPVLLFFTDSYDKVLMLENAGIGPAIFKRIVYKFGSICIDSDKVTDWNQEQSNFYLNVGKQIQDEFNKNKNEQILKEKLVDLQIRYDNIGLNEIVPVGQKRMLFSAFLSYRTNRDDLVKRFDFDANSIASVAFTKFIDSFQGFVEYCSITRQYKNSVGLPIRISGKCLDENESKLNIRCEDGIIKYNIN